MVQSFERVEGAIVHDMIIPACEHAAWKVQRGQVMRIIDVEGKQVLDFAAYNAANFEEKLSNVYTNVLNKTWKIRGGHVIYTNRCNPMFTIVEDTVNVHYSGGGFCCNELYVARFGKSHANCADNLMAALKSHGVKRTELEEGCVFNFFMNVEYRPNGVFAFAEPTSKPGDYIDLRAEMDVVAGGSCCPQDQSPTNGFNPTPLRIMIYEPGDG